MDAINAELMLAAMESQGIIEPIDDEGSGPLDWMDVTGVDLFDEVYHWTPEEAY